MRWAAIALTASLSLTACASGYDPLVATSVSDLQPGVSTAYQARRLLGRPTSTVRMNDGSFEVTWPPRARVASVNSEVVKMRFDSQGTLMTVSRLPVS